MKKFTLLMFFMALHMFCMAQDVPFQGTMSRSQLESYLSRSMACEFDSLNEGFKEYFDLIDFAARLDARYLCTTYGWGYGSDIPMNYGAQDSEKITVNSINNAYIKMGHVPPIIEAVIWEQVPSDVDSIWLSDEVCNTYHVAKRRFIYDSIKYVTDTSSTSAIVDISRPESQMYYYQLATNFIDAGFEAIHMGVYVVEDLNDPEHTATWDLLTKIRTYASTRNRGLVLLNADNYGSYLRNTDTLMFDFNTSPSRVTGYYSGNDSTWYSMWDYFESAYGGPGILEYNECSPYGKMTGGQCYMGWYADTLPYMVGLDNNLTDNCNCIILAPGCWTAYGYDEISWFVLQTEAYRNQWLCYAYSQVQHLDRNSYFKVPGRTLFTRRWRYYFAANGYNYNQEDAIVNVWNGTQRNCDANGVTDINTIWNKDSAAITIIVYPNPVVNVANIIYHSPKGNKILLSIENVMGEKITEWQPGNNDGYIQWNTTSVPAGIYIGTATNGKGDIAKTKIIVAK